MSKNQILFETVFAESADRLDLFKEGINDWVKCALKNIKLVEEIRLKPSKQLPMMRVGVEEKIMFTMYFLLDIKLANNESKNLIQKSSFLSTMISKKSEADLLQGTIELESDLDTFLDKEFQKLETEIKTLLSKEDINKKVN
ncbi:hypothetical protein [[Mycoplasma] testudinis]|uniref:hypothetical protein n=1 Tax=[Mycoplasma] testudinis TaxID=33924 RepID=UPI000489DD22|nr:hypothetical protein [[Mycoplasma] testudinis]